MTTKKDNTRKLAERIVNGLYDKKYSINDVESMIRCSRIKRTPIKINVIYVVTTLRFGYKYINKSRSGDGKYHSYYKRTSPSQRKYFTIVNSRTWGWYKELKDAQQCVEENWGDIYEGEYTAAVIERISEGILHGADIPEEWWYKWKGTWEKGCYKKWKKPKEYDHTICFMDRMKQIRAHWGDL